MRNFGGMVLVGFAGVLGFFGTLAMASSAFAGHDEKLAWSGDFRLRTEQVQEEQSNQAIGMATINRQRIRARLAGKANINEQTNVVVRITSGLTDASSTGNTNATLDDYSAKKGIVLDQAFVTYQPWGWLTAIGGKTPQPFYASGNNDMLFDSDLTFEGLFLRAKGDLGSHGWFVNLGSSWLDERNRTTSAPTNADESDVTLSWAQAGANLKLSEWTFTPHVVAYQFDNIQGAVTTSANARGNSTQLISGTDFRYLRQYSPLSYGLEVKSKKALGIPLMLFGQGAFNPHGGPNGIAQIFGLKIGEIEGKGDWQVGVDYREVQAESTLGLLVDADSASGGTDIRSTRYSLGYQMAEHSNLVLSYFSGFRQISTNFQPQANRAQIDLVFTF